MKSRLAMLGHWGRRVSRSKRGHYGSARAVAVAVTMVVVPARPAGAEPDSCKREIARADSRFSRAKMKALQKCYGDVVAGKAAGPCPDPSTAFRIFNARAKLQSSIAKRRRSDQPAASRGQTTIARVDQLGHQCVQLRERILHQQHRPLSPHLGLSSLHQRRRDRSPGRPLLRRVHPNDEQPDSEVPGRARQGSEQVLPDEGQDPREVRGPGAEGGDYATMPERESRSRDHEGQGDREDVRGVWRSRPCLRHGRRPDIASTGFVEVPAHRSTGIAGTRGGRSSVEDASVRRRVTSFTPVAAAGRAGGYSRRRCNADLPTPIPTLTAPRPRRRRRPLPAPPPTLTRPPRRRRAQRRRRRKHRAPEPPPRRPPPRRRP